MPSRYSIITLSDEREENKYGKKQIAEMGS